MRRLLGLLIASAVALAGCASPGGDDDVPPSVDTTPTAPTPPREPGVSLTSGGAIVDGAKQYRVASAAAGLKWSYFEPRVNGDALKWSGRCEVPPSGDWTACQGTEADSPTGTVDPGDTLWVAADSGDRLDLWYTVTNRSAVSLTVR